MDGRNGSDGHSSGVVKNRSSSGCLIIKKNVNGMGSSNKEKKKKKRPRFVANSDDYIELYPKRGFYEKNHFEDIGFGSNAGLMRDAGDKRSKFGIHDFNEYNDVSDVEMLKVRHYHDRYGNGERRLKDGGGVEFESGLGKGDIIYERRNSFHGGSSIGKIKSGDLYMDKRRFEMRNEVPLCIGKDKFDDAIRLQGKNGVLKVRIKHKENISELPHNYLSVRGKNVAPRYVELTSRNVVIGSSPYLEKNLSKGLVAVHKLDENPQGKCKPLSAESSEKSDEEAVDSESPPKLETTNVQVQGLTKRGSTSGSIQPPQNTGPIKLKEGKVKRGSGTEKQLLREKIRTMLTNAGWTIDYRPRRGRDYCDAVYVNPTGTAYWSIIKAYDALQKQLEEDRNILKAREDSSSFAPLSEDVLSKLTRQTRQKIEKELKRKKREETGGKRKKEFVCGNFNEDESDTVSRVSGRNDDKLSSVMKCSGKSLEGASKEFFRDGINSNSKMQEKGEKSSSMSNRFINGRNSKKVGRCMLLVRNSAKGLDSDSYGFIPYTGKQSLLSWLINCGTVKLREKVHYMNRKCTRVLLEGWTTMEGIHCTCCSKIVTVSKFEIHAASKLRQPYQNIYLSSGASLMQCLVDAWNRQEESLRNGFNKIDVNGDDPNDDTCAVCGDGGNLICCDSCPSTFHLNCLGIEMLPPGDWHCPHCSCKFCGLAEMSVIEGNDKREDTVLTCCLCERKYHASCEKQMDGTLMNSNDPPFCGKICQELLEPLQMLLGVKHELEAGLFWSLIHRTNLGSESVRGFPQRVEWNSKLAVALNVMDECFLPIIDRRSGINMIQSVLYNSGSNITRLNYSGFYTVVLEKGDEIVSAASIRIHGTKFAEMPFIGTSQIHRRQGMCRRLFSAIESTLHSLKVEKLIIPSIPELMDTWTTVFGFCTLKEPDKQDMKVGNMLVFPGTDMLQKKLSVQDSMMRGLAVSDSFGNEHNVSVILGLPKKTEVDSSAGPSSAVAKPENEEMKDKSVTDLGSEDMVFTHGNFLLDAPDYCDDGSPLPTENEETMDKPISEFTSGDMVGIDGTSLYCASVDSCKEVEPFLATEKEEINNKDSKCSEGLVGTYGCEELKVHLPTVFEVIKDKSISDSCSEHMILGDNSLPSASADCCKEVVPSLPTDMSTESEKMEKSVSSASADCHEEVGPSLATALPQDSNDNKPFSKDVIDDAKLLVSNGGCLAMASSDLLLDAKFNKSVGATDHISEDTSTGIPVSENVWDNSHEKHSKEASFDCEMTEEADVMIVESGPPHGDGRLVNIFGRDVFNGLQKYDMETQSAMIFSSIDEHEACQVHVEMDKTITAYPAKDNFDHPLEVKVDEDSHIVPAETDVCQDGISDNIGIDCAHEPKLDVSRTDVVCSPIVEEMSCAQSYHISDEIGINVAHELKVDVSRTDVVCSLIIEATPIDDVTCESLQNPSDITTLT